MSDDPDVRAIAARVLPTERVDEALAAVVPGWTLTSKTGGPIRVGGPALLQDGEQWPRNDQGVPMTFLAGIPLSALPDVSTTGMRVTWPHQNETLRVFADLVASPHEPCAALVLPAPAGARLIETPPPPLPDPWPRNPRNTGSEYDQDDLEDDLRVRELPVTPSTAIPGLTVEPFAFGVPGTDDPDPDAEAFETFVEEATSHQSVAGTGGVAKIVGAPWVVQDDPRLDAEFVFEADALPASDYVVLLEIHSEFSRIEILDLGAYYVCVPDRSLGTTYGPAFCSVQSC